MDTHVIDCILKQNNAFQPKLYVRDTQQVLSSETNESLESDLEAYSVNVTKINTLSSSIDYSLQSSCNQTNRLDNQIQFEEFELDESLNNEISNILQSNSSQISLKNNQKQINTIGEGLQIEEQKKIVEEQSKEEYLIKKNIANSNQKQFSKKSNASEGIAHEHSNKNQEDIEIDPAIENIQLKKEIENLNFSLKQQEKENFYLHQNIKTLKEELYGQKKKSLHEEQTHFFQPSTETQQRISKNPQNPFLRNSAEKNQGNQYQIQEQEAAASSSQMNTLNEQMHVLRSEMTTMKEMYLAKLKEQTFLVETLTKKLGEKDEFIQKMKNSYINSINQSKNSQLIQSQIYQNSTNQQLNSQLLQESCISDLTKPTSIQQSIISQQTQNCMNLPLGQQQQHFNNTFDQVKLSQEFEQLRRDIKFSTIGNISPFLRDEKGGLREDLLSTASNLQQGPNSSSNNSNYCNQSTNNYSKNLIQQQSPFNQSKYHNLSHMSNLSNRGFSNEFNPNSSINGNIAQHNSSQIHQQNQGSNSNITVNNQTGINCNNSTNTHLTSTSINSNNLNQNGNINNSHPGRCKAESMNQKRNSSFTNSSANASNNLNQSLSHQTQNTNNNQNVNNSILQFTPVSNKHLNQSNSGSQQNHQTMASQSNAQTQIQQTQKQQQITLDFRLTFNQNDIFNSTQSQQQQFALLSSQDSSNTTNPHLNNDPYIQDVEDLNQSHHFTNKQAQLSSQISAHQKQNQQLVQNSNNPQRIQNNSNLLSIIVDPENQANDTKSKNNSKDSYIYNGSYVKSINELDKQKDSNSSNNTSNNFPLSTKVQNTSNSTANKSLKEQLMNQQILQQKKQQILQNQQQQTYQNLIVKSNNQDLLKNLKKQTGPNQNQNVQQNQSSPKKQQSRSYHISSNQTQNGSNSKAQQNIPPQFQQPQQQIQSIQYQEYVPKFNNNQNQMINQSSAKNRKQNTVIAQGLGSCINNLQDNTIPSSTMSVNSNFSNNLPIFRSINNELQSHNQSCNTNGYNPNNNSFKFLNGKSNTNNNNSTQNNNPSIATNNGNQIQVEKKRFLQTTQISSSHNNQSVQNKFSLIGSPGKYSNSNSEQKQLFLRTQQIYPTSSSNTTNSNQQRQKSLAIPSQLSTNQNNLPQQNSQKVPMSAGGARKNNSLSINSQNTNNNTNIIPTTFNATTAHSTTSSHSSAHTKGLQDLFKFNQNEKQKKLNDFFSKTLQVKPGELKNLNENLGCYSNSKNAAKLVQQMEFSSLDDVEIQLDDLQILSNQIKEVLQNDPLKKNTEERLQKGNQINSSLRQSGGINPSIQQQYQQLQNNNNRSQSENHNYQNLQQQFQLHQQLNNCLNSQTVNVQSQYTTNPNKKIAVKSFDQAQNLQYCPEDQNQIQPQPNSYAVQNTTNQRVRPPKNNNFIFNENNKFIPCPIAQNPSGATTTSSATQHSRNYSANNMSNNNNNNLKNSNYKIHRKHLTLLNTDDISSKNQGNYAQSEISTQKAAFSDIHNFQNSNQNQYHQLY